jgi:cellulose synthase/poly-beta-1,6-N-acetylglucosamine synthase-like glycosyltransferase
MMPAMAHAMTAWICCSFLVALALLPGTLELLLLTVAGLFRPRKTAQKSAQEPFALTVVIPAHNEKLTIARCVRSVFAAEATGVDLRVVVVADNCTDQTASIARSAGARVLERFDTSQRGKGYALHYAFDSLSDTDTQAFAIVDADTEVERNFLIETAAAFRSGADATQCRYLVRNPDSSIRTRLMGLTLAAYNVLRPRGRANLGLSAGLYGNGFALSTQTVRAVPYCAYSVVEDLEYHLALLRSSRKVTFIDRTTVYADMPAAGPGVENQRARWEGGRLRMAFVQLPGLLKRIAQLNFRLVEPCLDLLLLPLAFHVVLLLAILPTPSILVRGFAEMGLLTAVLHLSAAAFAAGNGFRDLAALASAPFYILWKLFLIPRVFQASRKNAEWIRTERVAEVIKP